MKRIVATIDRLMRESVAEGLTHPITRPGLGAQAAGALGVSRHETPKR